MRADVFLNILIAEGFGPFTGVPCSLVKDLISCAEATDKVCYYTATSEGEAMGIAAGFSLSRRLPVVICQNDGFGNTVNPVTSLHLLYELPALMIITWRGEPGQEPDAPQHTIMGKLILDLLKLLGIPYSVLKGDTKQLRNNVRSAKAYLVENKKPYAFIIRKGYFESKGEADVQASSDTQGYKRIDYIRALAGKMTTNDLVLATTGFTGREAMEEIKNCGRFYMAGSMGCITSIGMGVAIENPRQRVYVLDGDGALLMKMGTLGTIGFYQPENFIHILFDNGVYESTGDQKTVSNVVNFPAVALSCGYRYAESVDKPEDLLSFIEGGRDKKGPMLCHVRICPGTIDGLKRPCEPITRQKERFIDYLRGPDKTGNQGRVKV